MEMAHCPSEIQTGILMGNCRIDDVPCAISIREGTRIEIPYTELFADSSGLSSEEASRHISKMIGAEIDYLITKQEGRRALASRKQAMQIRRKRDLPKLKPGQLTEARVVSVHKYLAVLEICGAECRIPAIEFSERAVYTLYPYIKSRRVLVKVVSISGNAVQISPKEALSSLYETYAWLYPDGTRCMGKVVGMISEPERYFVTLIGSGGFTCMCKLHEKLKDQAMPRGFVDLIVTYHDDEARHLYGSIISVR